MNYESERLILKRSKIMNNEYEISSESFARIYVYDRSNNLNYSTLWMKLSKGFNWPKLATVYNKNK